MCTPTFSRCAFIRFSVLLLALLCMLSACINAPDSHTSTSSTTTLNNTGGPPAPAPTINLPDEGVAATIPIGANPKIFVASGNAAMLTFIGSNTQSISTNLYSLPYVKHGNTVIINFGQSIGQPLQITIPRTASLSVTLNNGNVVVDSLQGQTSLTLNTSGTIHLKNFIPHGINKIQTKSGTIDVTFAKNASCSLKAQTSFGAIISAYSAISAQRSGMTAAASGTLNNGSGATVNLTVGYGSITIGPV